MICIKFDQKNKIKFKKTKKTYTGVTLASRGNFGHPPMVTVTPQCSFRGWPKLPRFSKGT